MHTLALPITMSDDLFYQTLSLQAGIMLADLSFGPWTNGIHPSYRSILSNLTFLHQSKRSTSFRIRGFYSSRHRSLSVDQAGSFHRTCLGMLIHDLDCFPLDRIQILRPNVLRSFETPHMVDDRLHPHDGDLQPSLIRY